MSHFGGFFFILQPSSTVHSPSVMPSQSRDSSHFKSSCDKPMGPKCGACGEVGHNKNSKICPQYFCLEAVQRREVFIQSNLFHKNVRHNFVSVSVVIVVLCERTRMIKVFILVQKVPFVRSWVSTMLGLGTDNNYYYYILESAENSKKSF